MHMKGFSSHRAPLRSLQHYHKIMDKATKMFVEELLDAAWEGKSIDIHHIIGDMTFNVVGESSFG